jgi:dihydropteroate synthase-like protein
MPSVPPAQLPQPGQRVLVITGKLAGDLARRVTADLSQQLQIEFDVRPVGITVAALLHVDWLLRKFQPDQTYDWVLLPGWIQGEIERLEAAWGIRCLIGPREIRDLPLFLGGKQRRVELCEYRTEILAEVNHAPRKTRAEVFAEIENYLTAGADVIDIGCIPGESWGGVGPLVQELVAQGVRVSIDSFDRAEVEAAVTAGAELVLSCSPVNVDWAKELDVEWVVIPGQNDDLESLWQVADQLREAGRRVRVDSILAPVGFGFAVSLARYFEVRRRDPEIPILMGVGNVTEMAEVDSAGVNFLLAAICEELRIGSVLTTQVSNWCQTSVREFDLARKLAHFAVTQSALPKHLGAGLVLLRDQRTHTLGAAALQQLATEIRDPNFRIFVERGELHILNRDGYWRGTDPFELFAMFSQATALDPGHAFYLGYELSKAVTALTLGKQYTQDEALNWGFLTRAEQSHRNRQRDE